MEDPQTRKLIPDARAFCATCEPLVLAAEERMELTPQFTALLWVRTAAPRIRLQELVMKRAPSGAVRPALFRGF